MIKRDHAEKFGLFLAVQRCHHNDNMKVGFRTISFPSTELRYSSLTWTACEAKSGTNIHTRTHNPSVLAQSSPHLPSTHTHLCKIMYYSRSGHTLQSWCLLFTTVALCDSDVCGGAAAASRAPPLCSRKQQDHVIREEMTSSVILLAVCSKDALREEKMSYTISKL